MAKYQVDFDANKEKVSKLREIDETLRKTLEIKSQIDSNIRSYADMYVSEQATNALKAMPVEELSNAKLGVSIKALRKAGITNIYTASKYSQYALKSLEGIGDVGAGRIANAVRNIVATTRNNSKIRLSSDDNNQISEHIVQSLYQTKNVETPLKKLNRIYSKSHENIENILYLTEPATNKLKWFFSSKEKKETALEYLEAVDILLNGNYKRDINSIYAEINAILKAEHDKYWEDFAKNAAGYYATLENIRANRDEQSLSKTQRDSQELAVKSGLPADLAVSVNNIPLKLDGLSCQLRPYQVFGTKYILHQGAVLLGDEMGLGKTIQAIATMVSLRNDGNTHFMVVCPASVLINWEREIQKFSDLNTIVVHTSYKTELERWFAEGGVAITTFETATKFYFPVEFKYDLLVVDEAHYVKNPEARRSQAVYGLRKRTGRALFMTGTALENRVEEMRFLISYLQPKIANKLNGLTTLSMAPNYRQIISPVYFRRTREDVLTELPDKVEQEIWCPLGLNEANRYCQAVQTRNFMEMRQVSWNVSNIHDSSKFAKLNELCEEAIGNNRKIIVFSFFLNTMEQVKNAIGDKKVFGPISGSISPSARQKIIDDFSEYDGGAILLSQVQAGGTGLNIQAASVIIFCEPQIKPSLESQAISRAYRMGQIEKVLVYRLLSEKSVDERIMMMLKQKQQLFDNFADKSVAGEASLQINGSDFEAMIDEELKRYKIA